MKRIALILALVTGTAYAAGPPAPYLPKPHMVYDIDAGSMAVTMQPTTFAAMLFSADGNGDDWAPVTGAASGSAAFPVNSYAGLLQCVANCTDTLRAQWQPWTGSGGGGGATFPATPGVVYNTGTTASRNATSPDLVTALNDSPSSTLSPTLLPSATNAAKGSVQLFPGTTGSTLGQGAINFHPNARTFCYGTSYTYGLGLFDQSRTFCANAGRDTPGVTLDAGVSSSLASADAINMITGIQGSQSSLTTPNYFYADPVYPSLVLEETFENDSNTINASFAQNIVMFMETWPTVPVNSAYSIAASAATAAGSPTTGTIFGIGQNLLANSAGSGRVFSGNTGSLTFNIPSSNTGTVMYFTYPCYTSGGTFTITNTTTSTSYVDNVSGTTTFNATCGGSSGITNLTPQTQRFTIAAGANTIVFAPSGANAANVQAYSVSWLPPAYNSTTGVLGLANQGVVEFSTLQASGPFSGSASVVNPIITSVSAQLLADGLPVFLSNQNTTETNGTLSARAWNSAVDTSTTATATCSAAQASNHPNECWQEIWWQHFLITQRNNGYYVSSSGLGGKGGGYTGLIDRPMSLPLLWAPTNMAHDLASSFFGHAIDLQRFQVGQRFGIRYGSAPSNGSPGAGFPNVMAFGSSGQNVELSVGAWSGSATTADTDAQYVPAAGMLGNGLVWGAQVQTPPETISFSATPTFSATQGISRLILTGNVTSSTLAAGSDGALKTFQICQDATGGRTFTWPTTVKGGMTISATASTCSLQDFRYSTASGYAFWYATTPGVVGQ